ncbi:hypothetical protein FSP39_010533 [Pinctada imbricata]|uniref:C2H2-type domain-containing protein n=1 Tax=Pinctada imbricata TaxID=66713 RepID=A0AA88YM84_PINIB|nr:hypothetical protein FSP39_010533 [Pinctada imbricata]
MCDICPRSFDSKEHLSQHKRDSHKITSTAKGERSKGDQTERLKCPQCNKSFTSKDALTQHIDASHAATVDGVSKKLETCAIGSRMDGPSVQSPNKQDVFTCKECFKDFKTLVQMQQHMAGKHGSTAQNEVTIMATTESFPCPGCSKSFATLSQREQHIANTGHGNNNFATANKKAYSCNTCSKLFDTMEQLEQHKKATGHSFSNVPLTVGQETGKFFCSKCPRSYTSLDALRQHEVASHGDPTKSTGHVQNEKKSSTSDNQGKLRPTLPETEPKKLPCEVCKRSFSCIESLNQHQIASHNDKLKTTVDKLTNKKEDEDTKVIFSQGEQNNFGCKFCKRSFTSAASLEQHEKASHSNEKLIIPTGKPEAKAIQQNVADDKTSMKFRCPKCAEGFNTSESLTQHQRATGHLLKREAKARGSYIRTILDEKAAVKNQDRKESIAIVKEKVEKIMDCVRKLEGGKIYLPDLRKAGSSSVKTKIGKADEFDMNITLNLKISDVKTSGHLTYAYKDKLTESKKTVSGRNMNIERELVDTKHFQYEIPVGQASVKVGPNVPSYLLHKEDLIPHEVQRDFHRKVKDAIEKLSLKDVHLSRIAHGPAITLTITRPPHNISVDLTVSLPCEKFIRVTDAGWPRKQTNEAFSQEHVKACIAAGIHLVPKGDETWSISYSKAEKALFTKIDGSNTCRRQVIQFMKWTLQDCRSKSSDGLPGISSFLVKQQVLWSSEGKTDPTYWHMGNIETCILETMEDFVTSLRDRILTHYFNVKKNLLSNKSSDVLLHVADFFENEVKHLQGMQSQ